MIPPRLPGQARPRGKSRSPQNIGARQEACKTTGRFQDAACSKDSLASSPFHPPTHLSPGKPNDSLARAGLTHPRGDHHLRPWHWHGHATQPASPTLSNGRPSPGERKRGREYCVEEKRGPSPRPDVSSHAHHPHRIMTSPCPITNPTITMRFSPPHRRIIHCAYP